MRIFEIVQHKDDDESQARSYMEGECVKLAVALNTLDPDRFKIGCIHEYTVAPNHDIPLDSIEYASLRKSERKEIFSNPHHWAMIHAFVHDTKTNKWIDARGEHGSIKAVVNLGSGGDVGQTVSSKEEMFSKVIYPISQHDIRQMFLGTEVNGEDLNLSVPELKKALLFAKRVLGIDISRHEDALSKYKPAVRNPYKPSSTNHQYNSHRGDSEELPRDDEFDRK